MTFGSAFTLQHGKQRWRNGGQVPNDVCQNTTDDDDDNSPMADSKRNHTKTETTVMTKRFPCRKRKRQLEIDFGRAFTVQHGKKQRRRNVQLLVELFQDRDNKVEEEKDDDENSKTAISVPSPRRKGKRQTSKRDNNQQLQEHEKFHCSFCGRHNFVTVWGAIRHQGECNGQQSPLSEGPWNCCLCGKDDFTSSQAFGGHWRCCNKGGTTGAHRGGVSSRNLSLCPVGLQTDHAKLSEYNQLSTKSIELFKASESDVQTQWSGNGQAKIAVGHVGIRCKKCAEYGVLTVGSVAFAGGLKTLPHNIYNMTTRHLLKTCLHTDFDFRNEMAFCKKSTISESGRSTGLGLPMYLNKLIWYFQLTEHGENGGLYRAKIQQTL